MLVDVNSFQKRLWGVNVEFLKGNVFRPAERPAAACNVIHRPKWLFLVPRKSIENLENRTGHKWKGCGGLTELLPEEGAHSLDDLLPDGWGFARLPTRPGRVCLVLARDS